MCSPSCGGSAPPGLAVPLRRGQGPRRGHSWEGRAPGILRGPQGQLQSPDLPPSDVRSDLPSSAALSPTHVRPGTLRPGAPGAPTLPPRPAGPLRGRNPAPALPRAHSPGSGGRSPCPSGAPCTAELRGGGEGLAEESGAPTGHDFARPHSAHGSRGHSQPSGQPQNLLVGPFRSILQRPGPPSRACTTRPGLGLSQEMTLAWGRGSWAGPWVGVGTGPLRGISRACGVSRVDCLPLTQSWA